MNPITWAQTTVTSVQATVGKQGPIVILTGLLLDVLPVAVKLPNIELPAAC